MKDRFSRLFETLRGHSRLRAQADAYADGELGSRWLARFEAHLRQCAECSRAVESARDAKALLASLPQEEAPRPFRLTPQMVNAPSRPLPRRPGQAPLRFVQAATALSAVALLAVTLLPSNGGSRQLTTAAPGSAASASESKAALPGPAGATAASGSQFQAPTLAAADGTASGASVPDAPRVPATGVLRSSAEASPSASSPVPARDTAETPVASVSQVAPSAGGGESRRWLEVSLTAVMAAAGLAWIALVLHTRRKV